jgi:hypothetical protein
MTCGEFNESTRNKITSINDHNLNFIVPSLWIWKIYVERSPLKNGKVTKPKYHWIITYEEVVFFYEYLKKFRLKSVKMHRN